MTIFKKWGNFLSNTFHPQQNLIIVWQYTNQQWPADCFFIIFSAPHSFTMSVWEKQTVFYFCSHFHKKFISGSIYHQSIIYEQNNEVCCCCLECRPKIFLKQISMMKKKVFLLIWKKTWFSTMFSTIAWLWRIFQRKFCKKKSSYSIPSQITLNNLIPIDIRDCLKGTINIRHCRGHDCIMLISVFDDFCYNHRRFLSENFYFRWWKNGLSSFKEWWTKNSGIWLHTSWWWFWLIEATRKNNFEYW